MTDTALTINVLRRMKINLVTYGWTQGTFGAGASPKCALGALTDACRHLPGNAETAVRPIALKALYAVTPSAGGVRTLMRYNDLPSTTLDDILDLIDRAIAYLEAP